MYANRTPIATINFITSHDGFSLHDLFAYNNKHNWSNGENNQDGDNNNLSWNGGVEGETDDADILTLRRRLMYNGIAILMLSQGIPMLLMGDEVEHTKQGNNNTYGHDNELNWFNWDNVTRNPNLLYFCQQTIAFRHAHAVLRQPHFLHQRRQASDPIAPDRAEISWHGVEAWSPDWAEHSRTIGFMLAHPAQDDYIYVAMNMHWKRHWFKLPHLPDGHNWHQFMNTGAPRTGIVTPVGEERPLLQQRQLLVNGRSVVVLVGKK
jgi:glycogen operon protein